MELRGWEYTGRNIGFDFHRQFLTMINCLSNQDFTNHSSWNNEIQKKLAESMNLNSSGSVRTVKRMCLNFGFLVETSLSSKNEIETNNLLTRRGLMVYYVAKLEQQVKKSACYDATKKERIATEIKKLYEEAYCDAVKSYYFKNKDNTYLHPLRATLRALEKYSKLDKWEWYLLNTFIRHDDDREEENVLDKYVEMHRRGELSLSMENVVENPKGHQYTPQHFEFAGLLTVVQRPEWSICDSGQHQSIKEEVLKPDFLTKLYGGKIDG